MRIQDFMTQGVCTVGPRDTLAAAAQAMWEHDCGALPVVDENGVVLAMITDRDACMAAYTQGKRLADIPVESAMSKKLVACRPDDALAVAEGRMQDHQVRRLPVVNDRGRLVGIVSLNDIALEAVAKRNASNGESIVGNMANTLAAICRHHHVALEKANDRKPAPVS